MNEIGGLGYLGVEASDGAAWERFACDLLGLELAERGADGTLVFRADEYAQRLFVTPGPADDATVVGWEVADDRALRSLARRLAAQGIHVTEPGPAIAAQRRVRDLIAFPDPAGLVHEAFYGPLLLPEAPFRSLRAIRGFVTGEGGLGHIVLRAPELDAQIRFFRDVLGFRLSDTIEVTRNGRDVHFVFFHCSPRHHSLALADIPSPRKLAHLMLELHDVDEVGMTYDLARRDGYRIAATLGRHTNDRMFSFYVATPSGWEVEIGCGGIAVDDATWQIRRYQRTSSWGHERG